MELIAADNPTSSTSRESPNKINIWQTYSPLLFGLLPIVCAGSDIYTAIKYWRKEQSEYAFVTMSLSFGPTLLVNLHSGMWFLIDGYDPRTFFLSTLLGIPYRHWRTYRAGRKAKKSGIQEDFLEWRQCTSDACLLGLYTSFLKSAPQAVLQIYVLLEHQEWTVWNVPSALTSLVFLATAVPSYDRDLQLYLSQGKSFSWIGFILQTLWRFTTITARIVAMVFLARSTRLWTLFIFFLNAMILIIYVGTMKRIIYTAEQVPLAEDAAHTVAVSAAFIFGFLNVYEQGHPRTAAIHSLLLWGLNTAPLFEYALEQRALGADRNIWIAEGVVLGSQVIGAVFLLLYWKFYLKGRPLQIPFRIMHKRTMQIELSVRIDMPAPSNSDTASTAHQADDSHGSYGRSQRYRHSMSLKLMASATPSTSLINNSVDINAGTLSERESARALLARLAREMLQHEQGSTTEEVALTDSLD
ncbi:XK-related protein 4-like isoform X2 [Amblyomma americanum]